MQQTFYNPFDHFNERLNSFEAVLNKVAETQTATAPQPLILTGEQLQEKLGITRQTLARWRKQKRISFIQAGSVIRYDFNKVVVELEGGRVCK